ncbi:MAG: cation transporter [Oscillospiraceae bacterium]|nr:cation transporter [Oscillospiraceae bacterium]
MTEFILKLFVKHDKPGDVAYRAACGKLAGTVGIVCNLLLFALKLLAGLLSGAVSIMADAFNNLTDASSSLVTLLGFKMAERPADPDHPYGHGRMEYLSGLIVAAMILLIGVELVKTSVGKIFHPEAVSFTWLTAAILIASVLVKLWLAGFCRNLGKKIGSAALLATAADSRNDVLATLAVLVAGLLEMFFRWQVDGYVGLAVALFILYSGIGIAKETVDPILGKAPDTELVERLREALRGYDKVMGIHDLIIHDYGPGRQFASVHVEMDSREDPLVCHDLIDNMEKEIGSLFHIHLVIHYDPIVTNDDENTAMYRLVKQEVKAIDERLSIHDFRMVRGPEHTNLIFDLVLPFDLHDQKKELKAMIDEKVQFHGSKYYTVITFDDESFN